MNSSELSERSAVVKRLAMENGFDLCGIASAEHLQEEASRLENWLMQHKNGDMEYMARNKEKRLDPTKLVEGARSVISLVQNYYPREDIFRNKKYRISKYAYGRDYHKVILKKLKKFMASLNEKFGTVNGRIFVDSAPVMERQWAARAGLGWIGKNTLLLNKTMGSYFFLAEAIVDLELAPDSPVRDYCGSCTKCVDACPTDAITPYRLDARRCISYLTIEHKNEIASEFKRKYKNWIFGCDICQEVCPWNRFSKPHNEPGFEPSHSLKNWEDQQWLELTEDAFNNLFEGSAVKRTKYNGLKRNIDFISRGADD